MKKPTILNILISKKNPSLNLIGPNSYQLFALWPNPNDLVKIKKSLTTPSGTSIPINNEKAVEKIQPKKSTKKTNLNVPFLFIIILF